MSAGTAVVEVRGVAKKHCRSLRHSMLHGLVDIGREILGMKPMSDLLRSQEFWALDDVSFDLRAGECLGVLGPNGAGKSTLLKIMNGIFWPDRGEVRLHGRVGSLIEVGAGFHPLLSGRENVFIAGAIMGLPRREIRRRLDRIVDFAELGEFIDSPVKHYSSGMYVRLGFAVAVHCAPEIMLVDEALAVGDASFQRKCLKAMRAYVAGGGALMFVSHNLMAVHSIAQRCLVLDRGKEVFEGGVGQASDIYYARTLDRVVGSPASGRSSSDSAEMRYGSGVARLTAFACGPGEPPDASKEGVMPLQAGRPAWVMLEIQAQDTSEETYVGFTIWDENDLPLVAFNTQSRGVTLPRMEAQEKIKILFTFVCPLASGRYQVGAGIRNAADDTFLDRRMNWQILEVMPTGEEFGSVTIPYDVNISGGQRFD